MPPLQVSERAHRHMEDLMGVVRKGHEVNAVPRQTGAHDLALCQGCKKGSQQE